MNNIICPICGIENRYRIYLHLKGGGVIKTYTYEQFEEQFNNERVNHLTFFCRHCFHIENYDDLIHLNEFQKVVYDICQK